MNSGLEVSNTKPTKTWDEPGIGIKGEHYTKPTKTWDELGIKGEQYETH